jgi:hypothetical protein
VRNPWLWQEELLFKPNHPIQSRLDPGMSEREIDDIEFDFFDEPAEEDSTQRRRAVRTRGPRGPRRPVRPPAALTPLLRLIGLIAAAILIVVLLVVWVQGCQSDQKTNHYRTYMQDVSNVAKSSQQVGRQLNDLLTTPGIKEADLETKLAGLAQQEQQNVDRAKGFDPPGHLREAHQHALEALQFRVNGLRGLEDAFKSTARSKDSDRAGTLLAQQAQRLVAGDVVWDDLFKAPATAILKQEGIQGIVVPDSKFVQNSDLASTQAMVPVWKRIHGAATGGTPSGLHGTGLVSVKALPSGQTLSTSTETTIVAQTSLAFAVTVQDTGDSQEVQIPVKLTIQKQGSPITLTQTIDIVDPGQTKTVTFRNIDTTGVFGVRTTLKVEVKPVAGESNTSNNSAEYPVIFSLGPP